jgi:alkylation response protein AidB-like acyl-CoA dehydrogenase
MALLQKTRCITLVYLFLARMFTYTYLQVDHFIKLIMIQESSHLHSRGYSDGLGGGAVIALPPIIAYASPELKNLIVPQVLDGKKNVCLAITEAFAGSDIQGPGPGQSPKGKGGIRTTAKKLPGGYRVTGTKKWITNAMWADWFVTACRVEDSDAGGDIIALIIPRGEGITTRPLKTSYSSGAAGTAFVVFEDVWVPEANLLRIRDPSGKGKEIPVRRGDGLRILLGNFNHER